MADDSKTWDGLPVSKTPPHGAAIVVFKRTRGQLLYLILHRSHEGKEYEG